MNVINSMINEKSMCREAGQNAHFGGPFSSQLPPNWTTWKFDRTWKRTCTICNKYIIDCNVSGITSTNRCFEHDLQMKNVTLLKYAASESQSKVKAKKGRELEVKSISLN